jgi:hypothetical protein
MKDQYTHSEGWVCSNGASKGCAADPLQNKRPDDPKCWCSSNPHLAKQLSEELI